MSILGERGWFGTWGQAAHAIRTVGGDIGKNGEPWVTGVCFFLGIQNESTEVVVGTDAYYYVDGDAQSLAALMNSTSYGVRNVRVYSGEEPVMGGFVTSEGVQ